MCRLLHRLHRAEVFRAAGADPAGVQQHGAAGQGPPAQLRPGGQARGVAAGHAERRGGAGLHHRPGQAHLDTADPGQVQRELAHIELYLVYSCIVFVNNKLYLDRCTMVFQCSAIQSAIY